jgi:phosphopantothenoylcysteine decarboxylase/phosphopantothenate--cysteine ligase
MSEIKSKTADSLSGKKILLGITGGIAAYKSCFLIREFIRRGAEVRVIVTQAALQFVTPLTLETLSGNKIVTDIFDEKTEGTWHIHLAQWADLYLIAPATLNTVAKIAHGFSDNPVTTLALARRSPMLVCPAADEDMYEKPVSRQNIQKLRDQDIFVLDAERGFLASGLTGAGRLPELDKIIDACETILTGFTKDLVGKKILITAGPTFEDIDPVRYIGNRSSGKMGYWLAKAAFLRGATVSLISGHTALSLYPEIKKTEIRSAAEMAREVERQINENDVLIMAAAVADYTPEAPAPQKIKKKDAGLPLQLVQTTDILKSLVKKEKKIIGFALESENEIENAAKKLRDKNLDMIVLNSATTPGAGFEVDTNEVKIMYPDGRLIAISPRSKFQVAHAILNEVVQHG